MTAVMMLVEVGMNVERTDEGKPAYPGSGLARTDSRSWPGQEHRRNLAPTLYLNSVVEADPGLPKCIYSEAQWVSAGGIWLLDVTKTGLPVRNPPKTCVTGSFLWRAIVY